jgi:diacylglycerol kinase (ATP)
MRAEVERRPELALLPQGTGDDFARALGVSTTPEAALAVARQGAVRRIDVGRAQFRGQTPDGAELVRYFASMAGTGMSGAVARRLNKTTKVLGGRASSLIATLAVFTRWRNVEVTVEIDGVATTGLTQDVLVANTEYHNGGMRLCPGATPDDGLLDALVLGDVTKRDLVLTLPKLYRGTYLPHPKATLRRGRRISVTAAEPLPIELDGEQPGTTPATFSVVAGALKVRVPG